MNQSTQACEECGAPTDRRFPRGPIPKTCSEKCSILRSRRIKRASYRRSPKHLSAVARGSSAETANTCVRCGGSCRATTGGRVVVVCARPECVREQQREYSAANRTCTVHYWNCAHCGKFHAGRKRMYCDSRCSNRAFNARRRADGRAAEMSANRRALEKGAKISSARRLKVLEAADWVCHLCELPTNRYAVYPAPDYPVIDHVIPLSKGGEHAPHNWDCAHNLCNNRRGNMPVEEFKERLAAEM